MSEIPGGHFESNENTPKLKQASPEDIQKVGEDIEYSNHLQKVNDVLNVLDYPDNIEEKFRTILDKQDDKTLIELSKQSKGDIQSFLLNQRDKDIRSEIKEQTKENQLIDSHVSKLKSTLTPELLNSHPDISEKLEALELSNTAIEKEAALKDILNILKEPGKLKSIIDDLGGANKDNPKYLEFKENLIGIASSFENYFNELENSNIEHDLNTSEIVGEIKHASGGMETIDLKSDTPISKLSLEGSEYSFDEKIDKQALGELFDKKKNKLDDIQNSYTILKGVYTPFDSLLTKIRTNWQKQDLKETLKNPLLNFSNDIFVNLDKVYKDIGIESSMQLKEYDFSSLKDVKNTDELRVKIENIKTKFGQIKQHILEAKTKALNEYKQDFKELVKRKDEAKERQIEVLKFMKNSGFDLIPKSITDKIITNLQSNAFQVNGLELNVQNIDLKHGHFGESLNFDNKSGFNTLAKTNLITFMNKLISGNVDEPLSVKTIVNGTSVVNEADLKNKFIEAGIMDGLGWKYSKMIENLKKKI